MPKALEIFRTCLTVIGIILLVIYGGRALSQASNMRLAGASERNFFGTDLTAGNLAQVNPDYSGPSSRPLDTAEVAGASTSRAAAEPGARNTPVSKKADQVPAAASNKPLAPDLPAAAHVPSVRLP